MSDEVQEYRCPHCGQILKFEGIDDDIDDGYCTFDFGMLCPNKKCRRRLDVEVTVIRTFKIVPVRPPKKE